MNSLQKYSVCKHGVFYMRQNLTRGVDSKKRLFSSIFPHLIVVTGKKEDPPHKNATG